MLTAALVCGRTAAGEGEPEALAPAASAAALAAPGTPHAELGARAGYYSPPIHGGTTPFGAGLGARFGYAFSHLYLGATGLGFFGGTDVDTSNHAALYGVEVGAHAFLLAGPSAYFVFRPHLGLGGVSVFLPYRARDNGGDDDARRRLPH
jgi:hypothetical protein